MRQIIIDFGTLELFGFELPLRMFGYGLMLVLGFLTAIAIARWRARRNGEDPEVMTQIGLVALISGIIGARAAYVIQHWDTQFASSGNVFAAMVNITSGGLTYYGGLVLGMVAVVVLLLIKRVPLRRYVDVVAPSLMIGLAFGRMGCLLNGCCFGAVCDSNWALRTTFPMYSTPLVKLDGRENPFSEGTNAPSPVYQHQLARGIVVPDAHLVSHRITEHLATSDQVSAGFVLPILLPPRELHGQLQGDQLGWLDLDDDALKKHFAAIAGSDSLISTDEWQKALSSSASGGSSLLGGSEHWSEANFLVAADDNTLTLQEMREYLKWRHRWLLARFDTDGDRALTGTERQQANAFLQSDQFAIAANARSAAVKPAQVFGIINAFLVAGILMLFHRIRRREGQVFALLIVMYPITRFVLEAIRDDNQHNLMQGILTHNQYTSLAMALGGVALFVALRFLPASAGATWSERLASVAAGNKK